jgi:hypothetical protein
MQSTIEFYTQIIGLIHGDKLVGAASGMEYFYLPNQSIAILHVGDAHITRNSSRFRQIAKIENSAPHTGVIDHFCLQFEMEDYEIMEKKLIENKVTYEKYEHSNMLLNQIWVIDPNNIRVEMNFCN